MKVLRPPARVKVGRVEPVETAAGNAALLVAVRYPIQAAGRRLRLGLRIQMKPGTVPLADVVAHRLGAGQLYEEFLRLRARLAAEGLFDPERKRPLPPFVRTVGVVTSTAGAALHDVVATLADALEVEPEHSRDARAVAHRSHHPRERSQRAHRDVRDLVAHQLALERAQLRRREVRARRLGLERDLGQQAHEVADAPHRKATRS